MSRKKYIEPNIILTLVKEDNCINIVVKEFLGVIIELYHIPIGYRYDIQYIHDVKRIMAINVNRMIKQYNVDTILIESNKLFINSITLYPDPSVLKNVLFQYSIQITIEDNYFDAVKHLIEIPIEDWRSVILNKKANYAVDLYKSHIYDKFFYTDEQLQVIESGNFYKTLCFSESVLYNRLMQNKYWVNSESESFNEEK